jgi:hypothetical protein
MATTTNQLRLEALKANWSQCSLFDFKENWASVKPAFETTEYQRQVWKALRHYANVRAMQLPPKHRECWQELASLPFNQFTIPAEYDSSDWRCDVLEHELHDYIVHQACHWVVHANLIVAQTSFPDRNWCIVESDGHSTVWDGARCIFDPQAYVLYPDMKKLHKMLFPSTSKPK